MGKGGDSSTANAEPLPAPGSPGRASLTSDAAFAPFLDASFNATEFASEALARTHMSAAAQTHQMQVWRWIRILCVPCFTPAWPPSYTAHSSSVKANASTYRVTSGPCPRRKASAA